MVSVGPYMFQSFDASAGQPFGKFGGHRFAADQDLAHSRAAPACVQEQAPRGWSGLERGSAMLLQEDAEGMAIHSARSRRDHDRGANDERQLQFEHSDVEGQGGHGHKHVIWAKAGLARHADAGD